MTIDQVLATGLATWEPEAYGPGSPGIVASVGGAPGMCNSETNLTAIFITDTTWATPKSVAIGSPASSVYSAYPHVQDDAYGVGFILVDHGGWGYQSSWRTALCSPSASARASAKK